MLWFFLALGCDDLKRQKGQTGLFLFFEPWAAVNTRSAGFASDGTGFAVSPTGLVKVLDDGTTTPGGLGGEVSWVTSLSDGSVLAGGTSGLQRTVNGAGWSVVSGNGLPSALTSRVREAEPGELVAVVNTSSLTTSLFTSDDWGENWTETAALEPSLPAMNSVSGEVTHAVPGFLRVSVGGQEVIGNAAFDVLDSRDGGATWERSDQGAAAEWESSEGIQLSFWAYPTVAGGDVLSLAWTEDWESAGGDQENWEVFNGAGMGGQYAEFIALDREERMVVHNGAGQLFRTTHPLSLDDPGRELILLHRDCEDRAAPYKQAIIATETVEVSWSNGSGLDLGLYQLGDGDLAYGLVADFPDGTRLDRTEYLTAKMMVLDSEERCYGFWEIEDDDSITVEPPK